MRNKIIILMSLLLLVAPIAFAELPTPEKFDWVQCWNTLGAHYVMDDDFYVSDIGVSFIFSYSMFDARSKFRPDRNRSEAFFEDRRLVDYNWGRYLYEDCSEMYEKIPYTIHHCWVKCDDDSITNYVADYTQTSPYDKPYTDQLFHSSFNTCHYEEDTGIKTIEFGCTLVMQKYWAEHPYLTYLGDDLWESHPTPYDMGFSDTNIVNHCEIEPTLCESYTIYDVSGCDRTEQYICAINQDCACGQLVTRNTCPGYEGEWEEWGNVWSVCSNVIVDSYEIQFELNGDYNSMTMVDAGEDEPTDPYQGGDQGGEQPGSDGNQIDKLENVEQELRLAEKSGLVLSNFQYLSEIVFSFILLLFYIMELSVTVFVFGVWIPGIFRGMIEFFKNMGR